MNLVLKSGIVALALAAASAPGHAQSVSAGVGKPIQASVRLANAGNTEAALAQVAAARAAAGNAVEKRKVGEAAAYVYTKAGRWADAARALEGIGAGPRQLAPYYYRAGNYDKAIELAKRGGGNDMQVIIAQSYLKQGDSKGAAEIYKKLTASNPGRTDWLENLASAQFKSGDKQGYLDTVRKLIKADPSPARWKTLLSSLKSQNMGDGPKMALYALMRDTGNLTLPDDVEGMAKFAVIAGVPGAAVRALDEAQNANLIAANDPKTQRLVQTARQRAQVQELALPRLPATPVGYMEAANIYFGKGEYPKAAALYGRAVSGNVPNTDFARMMGGISQVRAGNSGAAVRTFNSVTANSSFKDVAELWSLFAQTRPA